MILDLYERFDDVPKRLQNEWQRERDWRALDEPGYNSALADRAQRRMRRVDELPPDVRQAVYEYGLEIVWEYWTFNVSYGVRIAELIEAVRANDGEVTQAIEKKFVAAGVRAGKHVNHLVAVTMANPFPNGQNRFRKNESPSRRQNVLRDPWFDDETEYFVRAGAK